MEGIYSNVSIGFGFFGLFLPTGIISTGLFNSCQMPMELGLVTACTKNLIVGVDS